MTTIMQPFQCDLQPQTQETHRTTHAGRTTRCRAQRRNRLRSERPQPQPPHTGGTFHRRLQPHLHGKTQGFVLRLPHTALHQRIVMWCKVSHRPSSVHCSLTILFVRNSEDSFPTSFRQSSNLTISTAPPKQNSFLFRTCSFAELLWLQKPFAWNFGTPWHFEFHHGSAFISHHKSAAKATSAKAVHWSLASLALGVALVPSSFPVSAPAQAVSPGFRNPATSSRT